MILRRRPFIWLLAFSGSAGCATTMYEGPRRSTSEVAVIETDGTVITAADGRNSGRYRKVAVLPGLHAVSFVLKDDDPIHSSDGSTVRWSEQPVGVCFVARAGRTYTARPTYTAGGWRPEIIDQGTAERVDTESTAGAIRNCATLKQPYTEEARPFNFLVK